VALEFTINLGGTMIGGLSQVNERLTGTEKGAEKAAGKVAGLEHEAGKLKGSISGLGDEFAKAADGGRFFHFDLAEGFRGAIELASKLVEKVVDLGSEIVRAVGGIQDLNLAVELDVGKEGAELVDKLAASFAGTRFDDKDIKKALLPLLEESGMRQSSQWDDLVTAATDVATRRNSGAQGAASALMALRDIELQPQKIRGALKELAIKQVDFYADLGNLLGISAKEAEAQTKAGKVQSETLLSVALNQIAQREGGALGEATNKGSATLGATLTRLANLKENIFEKLAGSEGMRAIQGFLDNFIATLEGPIGTDLVNQIGGAFKALFGDLSGPNGLEKMRAAVGHIAERVGAFVDRFVEAWPQIQDGAESAIRTFVRLEQVIVRIAGVMGKALDLAAEFKDWALGEGETKQQKLDRAFGDLGGTVTERVVEGEGAQAVDARAWSGSVVPKMAEGGVVTAPTLALVGEAGPEAVIPLSQLGNVGGGGLSIGAINVNVPGGTKPSDANAIAAAVAAELERLMAQVATARGGA
jgi:hypothetical protein